MQFAEVVMLIHRSRNGWFLFIATRTYIRLDRFSLHAGSCINNYSVCINVQLFGFIVDVLMAENKPITLDLDSIKLSEESKKINIYVDSTKFHNFNDYVHTCTYVCI